jgi:hypothetical protein
MEMETEPTVAEATAQAAGMANALAPAGQLSPTTRATEPAPFAGAKQMYLNQQREKAKLAEEKKAKAAAAAGGN